MNLWEKYGLDPNTGSPPMAMDLRHVEMLKLAIIEARSRTAVEIGSHLGHSLVAFIEAMNELLDLKVHVFEPNYTTALDELIMESGVSDRIIIHRYPVWGAGVAPDFVFIDGDHGLPALADLAWCLAKNVRTIAMHDTRSCTRLQSCWGAGEVAALLKDMPSREWTGDCEDRPGEWTWRGFGVSTLVP